MSNNILIKKGLKMSYKGNLSIILFVISNIVYVFAFIWFFKEHQNIADMLKEKLLHFALSILFIFISIINAQQIFNDKPDLNYLKKIGGNENRFNVIAEFYKKKGFKRIFTYFLPTVLYIIFLFYTILPFTMGIEEGYFLFGLFWFILTFSAFFVLINKYILLSSFLVIYHETLVVRNKLKTYYFPVSVIKKIVYTTKGSKFKYVAFINKDHTIISFNLSYLKGNKTEVKNQLNRFDHIETESRISSRSLSMGGGNW